MPDEAIMLAQEVERLQAENATLREALEQIDAMLTGSLPVTYTVKEIARKALEAHHG